MKWNVFIKTAYHYRYLMYALFILLIHLTGCRAKQIEPQIYSVPDDVTIKPVNNLVYDTASELAEKIRNRELTSVEVIDAFINHIYRVNPNLNAIVTLDEEGARKRAAEADVALSKGTLWGPLHGVPVTLKDHYATKGIRTTLAYPPLSGQVPDQDCTIVKHLKKSGAIILGKTNLPVLATDLQTFNPLFGKTYNPWDLTRTPGGSSGGGAAAVASGMTPLDIGSDYGGSIRIPSHFCGVFGLKPTEHMVSGYGSFPGQVDSKDFSLIRHMISYGPMARSIKDLKLCLKIISGMDAMDIKVPDVRLETSTGKGLKELTIAWSDSFNGVPISEDTRKALHDFVGKLKNQGCHVTKLDPPDFRYESSWKLWGELNDLELGIRLPSTVRLFAYLYGRKERNEIPFYRMVFPATYEKYLTTIADREFLISSLEKFFNSYDAFLCPVSSIPAFEHQAPDSVIYDYPIYNQPLRVDDKKVNYWVANCSYVTPFNATGSPVVVIPAGMSKEGLPIGIQVVGARWKDMELLDTAELLYNAAGDYRIPDVAYSSPMQ